MPRLRLPFSLAVASVLTLGGGLAATAALFGAVSHLEYQKISLGFEQRAGIRVAAIVQGLDEAVEVVRVSNQLFATVDPVTRAQFHDFTAPLLQRYPFIQAFNFHRQLGDTERRAFEAALSAVRPGSTITVPASGKPAPRLARYHVVDFLEPMAGNEAAFGINVSDDGATMEALARAIDSGYPSATSLLSLVQDPRPVAGFLVIMPVYRHGAALASAAQRRAALIGDTSAIIRASELVHKILVGHDLLSDPDLQLAVYASGGEGQRIKVFQHRAAAPAPRSTTTRSCGTAWKWPASRGRSKWPPARARWSASISVRCWCWPAARCCR
jgi:CHASE1-domain containing sensor protein